jgi:hypothetical protein
MEEKIYYVDKKEIEISSNELLEILNFCEEETFFGGKKYLFGTSLRIKEDKEFYISKMINEAYRLGYEKGKLSKDYK